MCRLQEHLLGQPRVTPPGLELAALPWHQVEWEPRKRGAPGPDGEVCAGLPLGRSLQRTGQCYAPADCLLPLVLKAK